MADEAATTRSRRALLTAAAGAAGALAASAALPLTAMAHDAQDVQKEVDNATTATTTITNSGLASTALAGAATGDVNDTDVGYGVQGTSLFGWSVSAPDPLDGFTPTNTNYTGVFGGAPTSGTNTVFGTGVWGTSGDVGVLGTGDTGVYGIGSIGVIGESVSAAAGVQAIAQSSTDLALDVQGKVRFSRSGRSTIPTGKSSLKVTLAGVSSGSRIFAVLHTNRPGRWVSAVVPVTGSFTIYLNTTVPGATYVAWFILN